jgi:hypothetical protein
MSSGQIKVHALPRNTVELTIIGSGINTLKSRPTYIGESRTESIAEQPEQSKHDVRVSARVGHDLGWLQLSLLFKYDGEQHQTIA